MLELLRRKSVDVLVKRLARINLVLDAVQSGHQHGCKSEVAVAGRVWSTVFDTLCFRVGREHRDTDRSRTVTCRICHVNRRFEAGNQSLVGVGSRIGEGAESLGVLDDPADVPESHLRESAVFVAGEEVGAVFPDRLVAVHTGTVVTVKRLRHESYGLVVADSYILDDILEPLQIISHVHEGVETHIDLGLTAGGNLMVLALNTDTDFLQLHYHLVTQIVLGVGRGNREITLFMARFVAEVRELFTTCVPGTFDRIDGIEGLVGAGVVTDVVEDVEFCFRPEVRGVTDAGRLEIGFCLECDVTRIAGVTFLGDGIEYVADQGKSRYGNKRIHLGGLGIRNDDHVRGMNRLPATNGRTVESLSLFKGIFTK